jgi:hypothetical protein
MLRFLIPALLSSAAFAQNYYSAVLDTAQEVPPTAGNGRGWSTVYHDTSTNLVRIFVHYEGLSGAPTAAHMHQGIAGVNGPVIVPLANAGAGMLTGSQILTPAQATALSSAGMYMNVHTVANPGGEIRGQVVTAASTRYVGNLSGTQEVPPVATAAGGTAVAFLHEPDNRVVYMVNGTGLVGVVAAHFHQGVAGSNGPVIVNFGSGSGTYCGVSARLTAAQVAAWKANGFYANIHTSTNPGGEVRGQMIQDVGDHFVAVVSDAQEVPPTGSLGQGGASLIRQPNGTLVLNGKFTGLSGPPTAAHVHLGAPGINGPIVFPLTIGAGTLSATYTPTAADLTNLRAGNWYVNVHTVANPGGEIRGQLALAKLPAPFGDGCVGSNGTRLQIGATGFPSVGSAMSIDLYGGLPGGLALFAFGQSRDLLGGVLPLPAELPSLGLPAPNCFLLVDPATILTQVNDAFGCNTLVLAVPLAPTLRGANFYSQWFTLDPAANPSGFVPSSALTLLIQ